MPRPQIGGIRQPVAPVVHKHLHLDIRLNELVCQKTSSKGGTAPDLPYVVRIGFQGKIVPSPTKLNSFVLDSVVVNPVGNTSQGDLGYTSPFARPGGHYAIRNDTSTSDFEVSDPGLIKGEAIFFMEQGDTKAEAFRKMSHDLTDDLRKIFQNLNIAGNGAAVTDDVIGRMSLNVVRSAWAWQIAGPFNGLDNTNEPDTYGFFNIVLVSTYSGQTAKLFAGPPIQNRQTLPTTNIQWSPTSKPSNFSLNFPDGNPTNLYATIHPKVRYMGQSQVNGSVTLH